MLKYYSKPVLTNFENSAYKDEIKFALTVDEPEITNEYVLIKGNLKLDSIILQNLINENKIAITLNIRTNLHSYTKKLDSLSFEEKIERDYLERIDLIRCKVVLSANSQIPYPHNDELKSIYDEDIVFEFFRDEKMAESNEERIDYMSKGEPFIHIMKNEEFDNKGLLFSCEPSNMIQIKVGPAFHNAFSKLQNERTKSSSKYILNTNLAFDAILYTFLNIIGSKSIEPYKEKEWYRALDYSFSGINNNGETLDDFLTNMIENLDANRLFSVVQQILSNQIEIQVVETWRKAE